MIARRVTLGALALGVLLASGAASAQSTTDAAMQLYASGSRAYGEHRYADAARSFREAHAITHRPELLYNLALAQAASGDPAGAAESLSLFRDAGAPGVDDRASIERQIAELRAQAEQQRQNPQQPAQQPAQVQIVERRIIEPRWIRVEYRYERGGLNTYGPWVTLGAGVALGAVGIAMGAVAAGHASTASSANAGTTPWGPDAASAFSSGPASVTMAWVFGAAGGAAVAAGTLWLLLRGPGERREVRLGVSAVPLPAGGAMFGVGGAL